MKSRPFKTSVAVLIAVGVLATPAAASAAEPVAGCGAGFSLVTVEQTIDEWIDWSIYTADERTEIIEPLVWAQDNNIDEHLCVKHRKPNKGQDKKWGAPDYVVTYVTDNTVPGRIR